MSIRFKNENDGDWTRMSHLVQRIGGDLEKTTRQHTAHADWSVCMKQVVAHFDGQLTAKMKAGRARILQIDRPAGRIYVRVIKNEATDRFEPTAIFCPAHNTM